MSKTAVFTIVSKNYWAFARTLMQSLATVHPEWDRHVLLADRLPDDGLPDDGLFSVTCVEELPLPRRKEFLFRYTIMELNTAVKPWMFAWLRAKGYQRLIYLDPDILALQKLTDIERLLDEGATAVLTPHLTAPLADDKKPSELDIMRAGAYNLGFLALGQTSQADLLIAWWQQKLEYQAVVDLEQGLFTDQKWIDLVPGLFTGVSILRDPGYNVAYWNLAHRPLTKEGDIWHAGGRPLRFFHFSGFNPELPGAFSKHQNRFDLDALGAGKELALYYAGQLLENEYRQCRTYPYAFGYFDDGTPIPDIIRAIYREDLDLQLQTSPDPYSRIDCFTEVPQEGLPVLLQGLLLARSDLSACFSKDHGPDCQSFMEWFLNDGLVKSGIPDRFILPIKEAVTTRKSNGSWSPSSHQLPRHNLLSWGGVLEYLHCRWAGNPPSLQRQKQYRSITSMRQFLMLGRQQASRYFRGRNSLASSILSVEHPEPVSATGKHTTSRLSEQSRQKGPSDTDAHTLPGVNVIGYVRSEHGVGQSARLFSSALQAVDHPHILIDFKVGNISKTDDNSLDHLIAEHPRYPVNIFHINADQMPVVRQHLTDFFRDQYNIGFWHWELTEFPDSFLGGFRGLNEVWVPTGFVHDAVSRKSPVPVVKLPHAIRFSVTPCSRADFGLPGERFLFLVMYDFSSYQERKNPKGALDAFDRAFDRTDRRVALVIKTQNSHHHPQAREELEAWLAGRENVVWLDRTLNRQEVYNLESLCDCFLSLHRSEGFGLGPAESMYLGKPVIATNWSGTTEFMRQDNSLLVNYRLVSIEENIGVYEKGQVWADPDIDHAAFLMRQVVNDVEMRQRIGAAAMQSIRTELAPERIGRMQQDRLGFIQAYLR